MNPSPSFDWSELDELVASPWADWPRDKIPANWRDVYPPNTPRKRYAHVAVTRRISYDKYAAMRERQARRQEEERARRSEIFHEENARLRQEFEARRCFICGCWRWCEHREDV